MLTARRLTLFLLVFAFAAPVSVLVLRDGGGSPVLAGLGVAASVAVLVTVVLGDGRRAS